MYTELENQLETIVRMAAELVTLLAALRALQDKRKREHNEHPGPLAARTQPLQVRGPGA